MNMQKLILLPVLLVFTVVVHCQTNLDCSKYIVTKTDKMTGKTSTTIIKPIVLSINKGKTVIDIDMIYEEILMLSITATESGSGCCDKGDEINILFKDGSRLTLYNKLDFNCDGEDAMYFQTSTVKELIQLKSKKITTIRVNKSKSYIEIDFTDQQASLFMNSISCLSTKLKSH
jgi:hypothetical protein